ncbi:hypothetical protein BCV69DRAFT_284905 [Microstroma glucosiphilum]|uniref:BZIP domain-containing protein n=1 Tax=Pseudomicrostroma glucosiphilum TaxID=1684307 RepID=A0A316U158_9BASI|nr:hypothetical protein BCV69DRAFT_284905 [Pseudomicrostroma glucosiphilum]PWN18598.1 hypothetical protein BCV69DRAFT_284905 [Pseudomicrostroma glucosiphilum]
MAPSHTSYKRKASSPSSSIDDELHDEGNSSRFVGGSGSELVPSTKPGEPPVTKRTLQNRKAQREFRKRREARVKDLEERCRRFDQMGLEANAELQNMARRFKDENEALRALLVRLGYGNMIPGALEGISDGAYEDSNGESSSDSSGRQEQSSSIAPPNQQQYTAMEAPPGSVNPGMLDPSGLPAYMPQGDAMTVRWNDPSRAPQWESSDNSQHQSHQSDTRKSVSRSMSGGRSGDTRNGLLSLNFPDVTSQGVQAPQQQQQPMSSQLQPHPQQQQLTQQQQQDSAHLSSRDGITPGTFSSLMGMLGSQPNHAQPDQQQQQQSQAQGGGSAFLKSNQGPSVHSGYGMAHRPHQNDALLNPNPIPFAVNLSNEPAPEQSWWDAHGGGMFGGDNYLDDKANAVAQASAGQLNNGSQSPFDISAFLTSGHTPGGGNYNFNSNMPTGFTPALATSNSSDPLSQAGADLKNGKEPASNTGNHKQSQHGPSAAQLSPAEHIQVFLRILERRAIRAGEQRGQQQYGRRQMSDSQSSRGMNWMEMKSDVSSDDSSAGGSRNNSPRGERITPNTAYSRLAQHPVFLRTDMGELEELINSIPAANIATVNAQGSGSGAPLEVDVCALDGLMAMLDHRGRFGELKSRGGSRPGGHRGASIKAEQ